MVPERLDDDTLVRIGRALSALPRREIPEGARDAAVLVPLCTVAGTPSVLFTKRSDTVGTHKGQVSFPGGMADAEDDGPVATALRELEEELGFPRTDVKVLGLFHEARAVTGVRVRPVVGTLGEVGDLSRLTPSPHEIDHVFALSFADILDPEKRSTQMFGHRGPFPVFDAGPFPVWGLTAFILSELFETLFGTRLVDP